MTAVVVVLVLAVLSVLSVRVLREYERGVVFRARPAASALRARACG